MARKLKFAWQDITLDTLLYAGYDGQDVLTATRSARNIRPTALRQVGIRLSAPYGTHRLAGALGAEFLPDQSGQLLVMVLVSGDEQPEAVEGGFPGLPHALAQHVLDAALALEELEVLGSGVLRFDRALLYPGESTAELFEWLAAAVVRLLIPGLDRLPEPEIATLLELDYGDTARIQEAPGETALPPESTHAIPPAATAEAPEVLSGARPPDVDEPRREEDDTGPLPPIPGLERPPGSVYVRGRGLETQPLSKADLHKLITALEVRDGPSAGEASREAPPAPEPPGEAADTSLPSAQEASAQVAPAATLPDQVEEAGWGELELWDAATGPGAIQDELVSPPEAAETVEAVRPPAASPPAEEQSTVEEWALANDWVEIERLLQPIGEAASPAGSRAADQASREAAAMEEAAAAAEEPGSGFVPDFDEDYISPSGQLEAEFEAGRATTDEIVPDFSEQPAGEAAAPAESADTVSHSILLQWQSALEPEGSEEPPRATEPPPEAERDAEPAVTSDNGGLEDDSEGWIGLLQEDRYKYPPPARKPQWSVERLTRYLCAACGRYGAVKIGPEKYRCIRCQAVVEYRHETPDRPQD